jgi:hypothetical protein
VGPIALFDKSFLQSLSVDESLWFDHFSIPNICPLFYVETLADLEKSVREGRTQEQEVGIIAEKTPVMHGAPCAHHLHLCIGDLLGHRVPMTGQIPMASGRLVRSGAETGVVFDEPPEAQAFSRWQHGQFLEVERRFARVWREGLTQLDLTEVAGRFRALGIDGKNCKSLAEAKLLADSLVKERDKPFDRMKLALVFLNTAPEMDRRILQRWSVAGYPPICDYAPYAAHVVTVEVFFQIALAANLISSDRPSNRVDIAYLFYLPFCMLFVSSDRLHQRCAPVFLREDQDFVWGPDLKAEFHRVNVHFAAFPDETKEKGVMAFAHYPPGDDQCLLLRLWDRHLPRWRTTLRRDGVTEPIENKALVEKVCKFADAPALEPEQVDFDPQDTDSLTIQRFVGKRKGNWWQLPKDLRASDDK